SGREKHVKILAYTKPVRTTKLNCKWKKRKYSKEAIYIGPMPRFVEVGEPLNILDELDGSESSCFYPTRRADCVVLCSTPPCIFDSLIPCNSLTNSPRA